LGAEFDEMLHQRLQKEKSGNKFRGEKLDERQKRKLMKQNSNEKTYII
jgi:hypothetical protein